MHVAFHSSIRHSSSSSDSKSLTSEAFQVAASTGFPSRRQQRLSKSQRAQAFEVEGFPIRSREQPRVRPSKSQRAEAFELSHSKHRHSKSQTAEASEVTASSGFRSRRLSNSKSRTAEAFQVAASRGFRTKPQQAQAFQLKLFKSQQAWISAIS